MFGLGLPELLLILVVLGFLFGPGFIRRAGTDAGEAVKAFRNVKKELEKKDD